MNLTYSEYHRAATSNALALAESLTCSCYYCLRTYSTDEIVDWIDDADGLTAICPHCDIDAVVPCNSGLDVSEEYLKEVHRVMFGN